MLSAITPYKINHPSFKAKLKDENPYAGSGAYISEKGYDMIEQNGIYFFPNPPKRRQPVQYYIIPAVLLVALGFDLGSARKNTEAKETSSYGIVEQHENKDTIVLEGLEEIDFPDAQDYQKLLQETYGIKAEAFDNQIALKEIANCVRDFCALGGRDDLFSGLIISKGFEDEDVPYDIMAGSSSFGILCNRYFLWDRLENQAKEQYNKGIIPTDNPKYYTYKVLANFLQYKYNAGAFEYNSNSSLSDKDVVTLLTFTSCRNYADFNSSYIAAKMSGVETRGALDEIYEAHGANPNLVLPENHKSLISFEQFNFGDVDEAEKYFQNNFRIEDVTFSDVQSANYLASAIDAMCQIIGDNKYFSDMDISNSDAYFRDNDIGARFEASSFRTPLGYFQVNRRYNWGAAQKLAKKEYDSGTASSDIPASSVFIPQLVRYMQYKEANKNAGKSPYSEKITSLSIESASFTSTEMKLAALVSSNAMSSPEMFLREYIAGRARGYDYPKEVDELFSVYWSGPELNFPN